MCCLCLLNHLAEDLLWSVSLWALVDPAASLHPSMLFFTKGPLLHGKQCGVRFLSLAVCSAIYRWPQRTALVVIATIGRYIKGNFFLSRIQNRVNGTVCIMHAGTQKHTAVLHEIHQRNKPAEFKHRSIRGSEPPWVTFNLIHLVTADVRDTLELCELNKINRKCHLKQPL